MGPRIVNFVEWHAHTVAILRQQMEVRPDPVIQGLLSEVMSYPMPSGAAAPTASEGPQRYATPLEVATRLGTVSFLNTTTIFGTPTDVTLSELALEMLFPADEATAAIVKAMLQEEDAARPGPDLRLVHQADASAHRLRSWNQTRRDGDGWQSTS